MTSFAPIVALTDREEQILILVADGFDNYEIAHELGIGNETQKSHMKHILAKMNARNRAHAVALAYHHGVLVPKTPSGTRHF